MPAATETELERQVREEQEAHDADGLTVTATGSGPLGEAIASAINSGAIDLTPRPSNDEAEEDALFNGARFEIPFPTADGRKVDELAIKVSGTIELDRNNPDDCAFIESLLLGSEVEVGITALVRAKGPVLKVTGNDEKGFEETVVHVVSLKAHTIERGE